MKLRRIVVGGMATLGIAAAALVSAAPAQATTWGWSWDSRINCYAGTFNKMVSLNNQGYKVTIREYCGKHGSASNPYWYTMLSY
ncbi:hypothetical protein ACFQ8T_17685 [Isoptericola sp. NPDC056618]|uniref:hypothetical protein n=2 Tax=unclassified Isoptericola TaxID=2623355 RepID=UPI0036BC8EBC